jgi:hypothetical protein
MKRGEIQCDEGFIWDQKKTCYSAPNILTNVSQIFDVCKQLHGSTNIQFNSDEDVDGFIDLLKQVIFVTKLLYIYLIELNNTIK